MRQPARPLDTERAVRRLVTLILNGLEPSGTPRLRTPRGGLDRMARALSCRLTFVCAKLPSSSLHW